MEPVNGLRSMAICSSKMEKKFPCLISTCDETCIGTSQQDSITPFLPVLLQEVMLSCTGEICCIIGSTNPCRITRKVKQTEMYVCTLEEFILVDIWIHCCASWKWLCIGNAVVYIQSQQWKRNVRIALRSQLTSES